MLRKALFMFWLVSQVSGCFLTSYGVLRESFEDLAQPEGFGEGRAGEGPFGGCPAGADQHPKESWATTRETHGFIQRWEERLASANRLE
jgi:hypothetical protein